MREPLSATEVFSLQSRIAHERDESAYKQLFLFFYNDLQQFAYSIVKERETADEIYSDVMLKIWNLGEGLATVNNLRVYLFKAIRNTALNYLAKNRIRPLDIDAVPVELNLDVYNPETKLLQGELREKISQAIHSLPPKCQMVYKLVREDGLSYREVGEILGISEKTVDSHLNNALHKLIKSVKVYFS